MIKFTFSRKTAANHTSDTEVTVLHTTAPVLHRVTHAIRYAPNQHRIISFLVFAGLWAILEYVLHYEMAAKATELFGMAPFADKVLKLILPEAE